MEEKIKQWRTRYVVSIDPRTPANFVRIVNSRDSTFMPTLSVRWTQDEHSAISALLHILSPESERNVRYEKEDSLNILWLSCTRDRVLAAVLIDYWSPNGVGAADVSVKKMENPIESRILSTLAGEIPNQYVERVFMCVRYDIPRLLRKDLVSCSSLDIHVEVYGPVLWHKLLAIVGQSVDQQTTPVHDHGLGSVLCAVRIGPALVVIKKLFLPEVTVVLHVYAQ